MFDEELVLGGVLLNRIGGDSHKHWLQEAVESSGLSVEVLGGIPKVRPHQGMSQTRGKGGTGLNGSEGQP